MSSTISPETARTIITDSGRPKKAEEIVGSLRALLDGDEGEQRETFSFLKKALDEDRPSSRKLFPSA